MKTTVLKTGPGVLLGISNDTAQPGKTLSLWDGQTIILQGLPLDEPFFHEVEDENGNTQTLPGLELTIQFVTNLTVETDGENLSFYWQ